MKLPKRRHGDLTGPNSPYLIERAAYQAWFTLRHPILAVFHRIVTIHLTDNTWVSPLWVYGNGTMPAYSGVQFDGVEIEGDADSLRRLAALLIDRAERVEAVQAIIDAGQWPTDEDATGFPAGFERDVPMQDERLGNAVRAGIRAGA